MTKHSRRITFRGDRYYIDVGVHDNDGYDKTTHNLQSFAQTVEPGAIYIGQFAIKGAKTGNWSLQTAHVFYAPNRKNPEHPSYFGLFIEEDRNAEAKNIYAKLTGESEEDPSRSIRRVKICDATSVAEHTWVGGLAANNDIVISRHRHDFRTSRDGSVTVDGGADYQRFLFDGNTYLPRLASIKLVEGQWEIVSVEGSRAEKEILPPEKRGVSCHQQ